ncbi:TOBE domain-containing protein [Avibacterium sp. 20-15]|uniref:TOBE domain-containing protein n=1 Tax=unclassified Avibacterium TaxID=2685287 RepID=UPI002026BD2D|nr:MULTISPECIES: TOBE domain-containing protein [unclassified Avibacterium]MCW9732074.1 TOBE domain-containing protein [Avibacterium sp. 20-15]URL04253.1 TOBE domain-containing protein [Avibacterium sp. 20-132]
MLNSEVLLSIKLQQQLFVDPKRMRLLREIAESGSISQAAKNANVSYKSAWDHLEAMNSLSQMPLLERNTGGKNGGGTTLTNYAKRLLKLYDLLQETQQKAFQILQDEQIPLDSLLTATARFSLQSSARNQFFGTVKSLTQEDNHCAVEIQLPHFDQPIIAFITAQSAVRLQLHLGKEVMLMIKAPWVKLFAKKPQKTCNIFTALLSHINHQNHTNEAIFTLNEQLECCASLDEHSSFQQGDKLFCYIDPEQIVLLTLY